MIEITEEMLNVQQRGETEALVERGYKGRKVAQAGLRIVAPLIIEAYVEQHMPVLCPDPSQHDPADLDNPPMQTPGVPDFDVSPGPVLMEYPEAVWRSDALQAMCTLNGAALGRPGAVMTDEAYDRLYERAEQAAHWIATGERP